jgi:hypothetical protein
MTLTGAKQNRRTAMSSAEETDPLLETLTAERLTTIFDFETCGERFQVSTLYDRSLSSEGIVRVTMTLYPETEQLVGYAVRTNMLEPTLTTLDAFDEDDAPLGTFPDSHSAVRAIGVTYLKRHQPD